MLPVKLDQPCMNQHNQFSPWPIGSVYIRYEIRYVRSTYVDIEMFHSSLAGSLRPSFFVLVYDQDCCGNRLLAYIVSSVSFSIVYASLLLVLSRIRYLAQSFTVCSHDPMGYSRIKTIYLYLIPTMCLHPPYRPNTLVSFGVYFEDATAGSTIRERFFLFDFFFYWGLVPESVCGRTEG